jgi:hypothetical protein
VADLPPGLAIQAAWALASLHGDAQLVASLLAGAARAVEAAPEALQPGDLAALFEAAAMSGAPLPPQVGSRSRLLACLSAQAGAPAGPGRRGQAGAGAGR